MDRLFFLLSFFSFFLFFFFIFFFYFFLLIRMFHLFSLNLARSATGMLYRPVSALSTRVEMEVE